MGCKSAATQPSYTSRTRDIAPFTALWFSRPSSAELPQQVCHAEEKGEINEDKEEDSREWRNSPGVRLPKMTLICESEMEMMLPSSPTGAGTCDTSAPPLLLTTSCSSPPLPWCWLWLGARHRPGTAVRCRWAPLSWLLLCIESLNTATPKYFCWFDPSAWQPDHRKWLAE